MMRNIKQNNHVYTDTLNLTSPLKKNIAQE